MRSVENLVLGPIHLLLLGWSWLRETAGPVLNRLVLPILLFPELRRVPDVSVTAGLTSHTDDSGVDSSGDAVVILLVDFGHHKEFLFVSRSLLDILFG